MRHPPWGQLPHRLVVLAAPRGPVQQQAVRTPPILAVGTLPTGSFQEAPSHIAFNGKLTRGGRKHCHCWPQLAQVTGCAPPSTPPSHQKAVAFDPVIDFWALKAPSRAKNGHFGAPNGGKIKQFVGAWQPTRHVLGGLGSLAVHGWWIKSLPQC